jgi:hypothetical protein
LSVSNPFGRHKRTSKVVFLARCRRPTSKSFVSVLSSRAGSLRISWVLMRCMLFRALMIARCHPS